MSTSEEIKAALAEDNYRKSVAVMNKHGSAAFFDGFKGFHIDDINEFLRLDQIVCSDYKPKRKNKIRKPTQVETEG